MSTSTQYPKPNIVKLNPSTSTTRDNSGADGVSFFFYSIEIFIKILHRICHQLVSIIYFFLL
jgi:hypothetical protein